MSRDDIVAVVAVVGVDAELLDDLEVVLHQSLRFTREKFSGVPSSRVKEI